jgi:hypothetical protein
MNSKSRDLLLVWIVILFANRATFGQLTRGPRTISPVADALGAPTITIFTAATGTLIRSLGPNNASLDLGRVSYFQGVLVPGQTVRKSFGSIMISTRFNLRVDCPGSPSFSRVNVTISRRDEDGSYAVSAIHALRLRQRASAGCERSDFFASRTHRQHPRTRGYGEQIAI